MMACSRTFFCNPRGLPFVGLAFVGLALVGLVSIAATQLNAQDPVLSELYGRGVHQYFAGHYSNAHELLDLTIKEGDLDPRAYYFRGLSYSRLGRPDEAKADFARAAELEVENTLSAFNVGRALERIQGGERLEIERIRRMARVAARGKTQRRSRARYERFKQAEPRVLRGAPTGPTTPPIPPAAPLESNAQPVPDPFGAGGLGSGQATPAKPAAGKPAPNAPPKPMPVAPDEDPFGNDVDPFGDKSDAPKADAETDPFGDTPSPATPPPADDDDPFK